MRKIITVTILALLLSASAESAEKMRIAIMDLQPNNVPVNTSRAVSDLIKSDLVDSGMFTIVEREQINDILKEQSLQMSGCTDNACAIEIGKLLSANKIIVGEISAVGKTIIITIRVVDVKAGVAEFSSSEKTKSIDTIDTAANNLVKRLIDTIGGKRISDLAGFLDIPENVTATDGEYKDKIVVSWSPVKDADKYFIFKLMESGKYELVDTVAGTSFTDKNVKEGVTYHYKIRAGILTRTSEFSEEVSGMSGKSVSGYYLRGIVPGWGQMYYRNNMKGYIFLGSFILATAFAGYSINDYMGKKDDYNNVPYYSSKDQFDSKYDAYNKAGNIAIFASALWIAVYIANWADLIWFNEPVFLDDAVKQSNSLIKFNIFNDTDYNRHGTGMVLSANLKF